MRSAALCACGRWIETTVRVDEYVAKRAEPLKDEFDAKLFRRAVRSKEAKAIRELSDDSDSSDGTSLYRVERSQKTS